MAEEDILEEFITECTEIGVMHPTAMRDRILDRIKEIDEKIEQADKLRPERQKMMKILQGLGFELPKVKRAVPIKDETAIQDLDNADLSIAIKICEHVAKAGPSTASALMKACRIGIDDGHQVYNIIKWLCANGYCSRNTEGNQVIKGPNWKDRPVSA